MSEEEKEPTAEQPEAPSPPEPPAPVPEAQEPEAAAAEEQEAPKGEAPESGTSSDEGASQEDQIAEALATIAKDNPAAFDKAVSQLPEEMQEKYRGSDDALAQVAAKEASAERLTGVQSAYSAYQPYSQTVDATEWRRAGEDMVRSANEAVKKAIADGNEDAEVLPKDFADQLASLAEYGNGVRANQQGYLSALYQNALHTKLESSKVHRFLTAEDRESVKSMSGIDAIDLYFDVALKAAPKAVKEAAKAEADKTVEQAGVLEILEKIAGGKGREATKSPEPTKKAVVGTKEWAENTPVPELVKARKR